MFGKNKEKEKKKKTVEQQAEENRLEGLKKQGVENVQVKDAIGNEANKRTDQSKKHPWDKGFKWHVTETTADLYRRTESGDFEKIKPATQAEADMFAEIERLRK